ncbi:MAG: GGDEF domain-containing protein [Candidatus Saccharibacteria bacterium]|nr:GGDEF domain-containing protein [Candidatus Saccharibacteria bacterium]
MTERDAGGDKPDKAAEAVPIEVWGSISDEIRTAEKYFKSSDYEKRVLAQAAIIRASTFGVENPEAGQILSRLFRVREEEDDIPELASLHRANENVRKSLERLSDLTGGIHEVFMDLNPDGYISLINDAITPITGLGADAFLDMNISQIVDPDDAERVTNAFKEAEDGVIKPLDFRINDINGNAKWLQATSNMLRDEGEPCGFVVALRDITLSKEQQIELEEKNAKLAAAVEKLEEVKQELEDKSEHDALTGLYNPGRAKEELEFLRKEGRRMVHYPVSILFIDADNFKDINDGPGGHDAGDAALQDIASLIRCGKSRREDFLARYGGDEFIFILRHTSYQVAQKVVERINNAFMGHRLDRNTPLSVSIGVATATKSKGLYSARSRAEARMYDQKRTKKGEISVDELRPILEE